MKWDIQMSVNNKHTIDSKALDKSFFIQAIIGK